MKKLLSIFIILLIFSSILIASNTLKDIKTLIIYIANVEFKGEKFLQNNLLYCNLDELRDYLGITYKITDQKSLLISNGIEYKTSILFKNKKVYVPLTCFSQTMGYTVTYSESVNVLKIAAYPYNPNSNQSNQYNQNNNQYNNSNYNSSPSSDDVTATQCLGICKDGHRCLRMTKDPSGYCWQHKQ